MHFTEHLCQNQDVILDNCNLRGLAAGLFLDPANTGDKNVLSGLWSWAGEQGKRVEKGNIVGQGR